MSMSQALLGIIMRRRAIYQQRREGSQAAKVGSIQMFMSISFDDPLSHKS
jgi:hypothetical protein